MSKTLSTCLWITPLSRHPVLFHGITLIVISSYFIMLLPSIKSNSVSISHYEWNVNDIISWLHALNILKSTNYNVKYLYQSLNITVAVTNVHKGFLQQCSDEIIHQIRRVGM